MYFDPVLEIYTLSRSFHNLKFFGCYKLIGDAPGDDWGNDICVRDSRRHNKIVVRAWPIVDVSGLDRERTQGIRIALDGWCDQT